MTLKKRIWLLVIIIACCSSINAQTTKMDSCEGLKEMFDKVIYRLDSITGSNITLTKQLDSIRLETARSKTKINTILKEKNETVATLNDAKKLIQQLNNKIKEQEAEIKRLSGNKPSTKKTN